MTTLIEARDERSFLRLKAQFAKLDLLVLDELGYVPASKVGAELLFDVISTAYERTSLIVTTNLPFESWTEVLGSERLTGATLDRLTHRCRIIETKGESYRLHDAKARTNRSAKSVTATVDESTPSMRIGADFSVRESFATAAMALYPPRRSIKSSSRQSLCHPQSLWSASLRCR